MHKAEITKPVRVTGALSELTVQWERDKSNYKTARQSAMKERWDYDRKASYAKPDIIFDDVA